jgi:hypothetical protein
VTKIKEAVGCVELKVDKRLFELYPEYVGKKIAEKMYDIKNVNKISVIITLTEKKKS